MTIENIEELRSDAVRLAKDIGVTLNGQESDLDALETRILPMLESMAAAGKLTDARVTNLACVYGVYLGELMLRQFAAADGFAWVFPADGSAPYLGSGERKFRPIPQTYQRILQGSANDIRPFYQLCKKLVQDHPGA